MLIIWLKTSRSLVGNTLWLISVGLLKNDKAGGYNQHDPRYVIDEYGRYQPAVNRFPFR